jgi:hypothetical protein
VGRHGPTSGTEGDGVARPSDAALENRILSKIGTRVRFKYPEAPNPTFGVLRDRVVIQSQPNAQGIPYWDVIDLIEFPDTPEPMWMRVGYYRFVNGRLNWGSQTTLTDPLSVWLKLFTKAKTRPWFAPLLRA